jgi:hypothetical protein
MHELFSSYLEHVGFKRLETNQPIGTRSGKVQSMVFQRPGSAYDDAIRIDANSIDDLFAIRTAYARYYFMTALRAVGEINVAKIDLAGIYQV